MSIQGFQTLDAESFKKIQPRDFHRRFFDENVRADGRWLTATRSKSIATETNGVTMGHIGSTSVFSKVTVELQSQSYSEPTLDDLLTVSLLFPHVSTTEQDMESVYTYQLKRCIVQSHILSLSQLIRRHDQVKAAFHLHLTLQVLNDDGNVLSACIMTMMSCLKALQLPSVYFHIDTHAFMLGESEEHETIPASLLELRSELQPYSYHIFSLDNVPSQSIENSMLSNHKNSNKASLLPSNYYILADANKEEESIADGHLLIIKDLDHQLVLTWLSKGPPLDPSTLQYCLSISQPE